MILAHLSDLHLGFRAFERGDGGRNPRERDVAAAFERVVQRLVELRPGVVVVTGDVFDRHDPSPGATLTLVRGLRTLRTELPDAPVLVVAGARDVPRTGEPGALAVVAEIAGVHVATDRMRSLTLLDGELHACLLPWRAHLRRPLPDPVPDPAARWRVLAAYGRTVTTGAGVPVDPDAWSHVAVGSSHVRRDVRPGVHYPGALERVGEEPWGEAATAKGFLTRDLEGGGVRFHPVHGRPVVALAPIRVAGDPDRIRRRVLEVAGEVPGGIDGKIVHLTLRGVPPSAVVSLQGEVLVGLRRRAMHLLVEADWDAARAGPSRALARAMAEGGVSEGGEGRRRDGARLQWGEIPDGVVAVVSRRADGLEAFRARLGDDPGALPGPRPGGRGRTPEEALLGARAALIAAWGGDRLAHAVDDVAPGLRGGEAAASWRGSEELGRRLQDLEDAPRELRRAEAELGRVRADHAEAAGDLEEATMEWHRERQDAETQLQAYRDRARELKGRLSNLETGGDDVPCPTCGRPLGDHLAEVVQELRDEWESVVQDGKWWRRRREQLDPKPESLQELEGRHLRLQAAVEEMAERVERARSRVRELDELKGGTRPVTLIGHDAQAGAGGPGRDGDAAAGVVGLWLALDEEVSTHLLEGASRYLNRLTAGRVLALTADGPGVRLEGWQEPLAHPAPEDRAAAVVAIDLATAVALAAAGADPPPLILSHDFDALAAEARLRCVDMAVEAASRLPRVVVATSTDIADLRPEAFDVVLRVDEAGGEPEPVPSGPGALLLV